MNNDKIVQIITSVIQSDTGVDQLSIHGLSNSGILYQLITDENMKPVWVKVCESPLINN